MDHQVGDGGYFGFADGRAYYGHHYTQCAADALDAEVKERGLITPQQRRKRMVKAIFITLFVTTLLLGGISFAVCKEELFVCMADE